MTVSPLASTGLGFGCAGLLRVPTRRRRQDLLAAAFDAGISHFDVARMYGLGAAEGELGRFARGRRDRITIATKFGIEATATPWMARLQGPARAVIARYPALRRAIKRRDEAFHQTRRYDVATARESLERSLTELRTDYVDILFLHDPLDPDDATGDELREFLEAARAAGKIRAWGVAVDEGSPDEFAGSMPGEAVLQMRADIFARRSPELASDRPCITFGLLSSALSLVLSQMRTSETARRRWSDAVGADCADPEVVAAMLIRDGLQANPDGVVLYSTTRPARVASAVAASELGADPALSRFRELVTTELGHAIPPVGASA